MKGEEKLERIPAHFHFGTKPVTCPQMMRKDRLFLQSKKLSACSEKLLDADTALAAG